MTAFDDLPEPIKQMRADLRKGNIETGATGEHPGGKIAPSDDGAIMLGVAAFDGLVYIDLGNPTTWLAMPPEQAISFAHMINHHALAAVGSGEPKH